MFLNNLYTNLFPEYIVENIVKKRISARHADHANSIICTSLGSNLFHRQKISVKAHHISSTSLVQYSLQSRQHFASENT